MDSTIARPLSKDGSIHVTDEFYNTLFASVGAVLSTVGVFILISLSLSAHKIWHILSFSIYGAALLNLFVCSSLHHGVNGSEKTEHRLRQLDYFAIFLMIAGTFTPFCMIVLRTPLGLSVLGLVWLLAIVGILLKALNPTISKWVLASFFLGMGWLGAVIAWPLYQHISGGTGLLLMMGGVFYTLGAVIYYRESPNPIPGKFGFHEIWHLFVLAGASCHFLLMYYYLLPFQA